MRERPRSANNDPQIASALAERGALWIFGYGSLMWDPGFHHAESHPAVVHGYHRRFCVYSYNYRGTRARPGLVLGLDRGGACKGIVYRVPRRSAKQTLAYLWERELDGGVYRFSKLKARLARRVVEAYSCVVDRAHLGYAAELSIEETARLICQGIGKRGLCLHYLENTVRHIEALGLTDGHLHRLLEVVQGRAAKERRGRISDNVALALNAGAADAP
ncbi:MAG: gamma-glutamylcyclotransferase [Stellaceae bacterium]